MRLKGGIVGIALGAAHIECPGVPGIQRRARSESLGQVGVGNEQLSKRHGIRPALVQRLLRPGQVKAFIGDIGAAERLFKFRADGFGIGDFLGAVLAVDQLGVGTDMGFARCDRPACACPIRARRR